MFKNYSAEDHKWFQNWEKNFDATLKGIKKFKEDLSTKPNFTPITAQKYRLYIDLLESEIMELKEVYEEYEPRPVLYDTTKERITTEETA